MARLADALRSVNETIGLCLRLMDRASPIVASTPRCDCAGCEAIRARGFECSSCGYVGVPLVYPCDCREQQESGLAYHAGQLAALRADRRRLRAEEFAAHKQGWLPRGETLIQRYEHMVRLYSVVPGICSPVEGKRRCAHGAAECPVCADGDLSTVGIQPWAIVSAVRGQLRAARRLASTKLRAGSGRGTNAGT